MTTTPVSWLERRTAGAAAPAGASPSRLTCSALVLLAGVVRHTDWHRAIGRALLDLPIDQEQSLLDLWSAQAVGLARAFAPAGMALKVCLDHASPAPAQPHLRHHLVRLDVDRDPRAWRGSGGVLRDIAAGFDDAANVVAAHAAQVPLRALRSVVADLAGARADAAVVTPDRGACGSVALLRCGCLRDVPQVGFCDFHEQALPIIAAGRFVTRAVPHAGPVGVPVRTRAEYVQALRQYHRTRQGVAAAAGAMAEDWKPAFGIVERGAAAHPSAQVLDSVVLAGARVERDAVLVRSVVCPGAVVRRGRVVVDQLVRASR